MPEITVDVRGITEVFKLLHQFPDNTFKAATAAMRVATVNAKRKIQSNFTRYNGTRGGDRLQNRTGDLRRSIKRETSGNTLSTLFSRVFSTSEYASIHEFGGTIIAKDKYVNVPGGPYLNIPTPSNLSGSGIILKIPAQIFAEDGGHMFKSKAGRWIVADGQGTPMFVLVKSVTIKPRLGMNKAVESEIPTLLGTLSNELFKGQ